MPLNGPFVFLNFLVNSSWGISSAIALNARAPVVKSEIATGDMILKHDYNVYYELTNENLIIPDIEINHCIRNPIIWIQ